MKTATGVSILILSMAICFMGYRAFTLEMTQVRPPDPVILLNDGRKIDAKSLKKILEEHKKWISTSKREGEKADLSQVDFKDVDLSGAVLSEADLSRSVLFGANLAGIDLSGANLSGAKLSKANLSKANLSTANLFEADLLNADLTDANLSEVYGRRIDAKSLKKILDEHKRWISSNGKEGKRADLSKVDFSKADLSRIYLPRTVLSQAILANANLSGANLELADLSEAILANANLSGVILEFSDLSKVDLSKADLSGSNISDSDLSGANLENANLKKADLSGVNLTGASLRDADLHKSILRDANLNHTLFEFELSNLPNISGVAQAHNLSHLKYKGNPQVLVELRRKFKDYGLRRQERELTYAIKHTGAQIAFENGDLLTKIELFSGWLAFDLTCQWGMASERPLLILIGFIFLFSAPYTVSLSSKVKKDGIWKVWIPERVRTDIGKNEPELLGMGFFKAIRTAFYFSLLSAFNIGWRDLNVGNWISRIQPQEFKIQASGWVRTVSGIQSILTYTCWR